jgi:hypothetical protein
MGESVTKSASVFEVATKTNDTLLPTSGWASSDHGDI